MKQISEKTVFLVAFSTLSRYYVALTEPIQSPYIFIFSYLPDRFLLRVSSILVLGAGVHDGSNGAVVDLVDLEKVTTRLY